jgi:hypothetical protein
VCGKPKKKSTTLIQMNSIYTGKGIIIPLADIQHCQPLFRSPYGAVPSEKGPQPNGLHVITGKTTYNRNVDDWENPAYVPQNEVEQFLEAWRAYRERVEMPMVVMNPGPIADVDLSASPKKIRRVVMGSFSPGCGDNIGSWQLWVQVKKGWNIRIETMPNLSSEEMLGCTIEFREPSSDRGSVSWMTADKYELVHLSNELRAKVLNVCNEISNFTMALEDRVSPEFIAKLLFNLGEWYGINPTEMREADSIGEVLCQFAVDLHARSTPPSHALKYQ